MRARRLAALDGCDDDGRRPRRAEAGHLGFRAAGGFSFLYALGAELVLADRPAPIAAGTCATSSCPGALSAGGDLTTVVRAALGYAF